MILAVNWDYKILEGITSSDFELSNHFGIDDTSNKTKLEIIIRNHFSLVQLLIQNIHMKYNDEKRSDIGTGKIYEKEKRCLENYSGLKKCIYEFSKYYSGKFLCLCISTNDKLEKEIKTFCKQNSIPYASKNIQALPGVNNGGHFNKIGNYYLGRFLYESFRDFYK